MLAIRRSFQVQPGFQCPRQTNRNRDRRHVRVDLFQTDQHVPKTDSPSSRDIIGVVRAVQQFSQPLKQRPLEPQHLFAAAGDDPLRIGMALNLRVEVVDEIRKTRFDDAPAARILCSSAADQPT